MKAYTALGLACVGKATKRGCLEMLYMFVFWSPVLFMEKHDNFQ